MLENGYIKLRRSLTGWRWYKDGNVLRLWVHLLISANYEACSFQDREVKRGELVTSLKSLSEQTGMTVKEIRTALDKLKRTGEITTQSNRHYTLISVKNYDAYQSDAPLDTGKPTANQGQTEGKPTANQGQSKGNNERKQESKKARKQEERGARAPDLSRFHGELLRAVQDWLRYKAERKEPYTQTGGEKMLSEIENRAKKHGDKAVADLIDFCIARQWRGIIWDRIESVPVDNTNDKHNVQGELTDWEKDWLDQMNRRKGERESLGKNES